MLAAPETDASQRVEATPGAVARCPQCGSTVRPKCGPIVAWHWAHIAADCDPWSEPESHWHLGWKRYLRDHLGAQLEVPIGNHRADAILPGGTVVELQSAYLSADAIVARETHWGRGVWVYRCTWAERIHWGPSGRGFWWKHAAKSQLAGSWPIWWDMGQRLLAVRLGTSGSRVLGYVTGTSHDVPNQPREATP